MRILFLFISLFNLMLKSRPFAYPVFNWPQFSCGHSKGWTRNKVTERVWGRGESREKGQGGERLKRFTIAFSLVRAYTIGSLNYLIRQILERIWKNTISIMLPIHLLKQGDLQELLNLRREKGLLVVPYNLMQLYLISISNLYLMLTIFYFIF